MSSQGNIFKSSWYYLKRGEFSKLFVRVFRVLKKIYYYFLYQFRRLFILSKPAAKLDIISNFRVAFNSPDHLCPHGTKLDNSTSKIFIVKIKIFLRTIFPRKQRLNSLDLGCSGGGLVSDFLNFGFTAVGLEGSDYSLIHQRAEWKHLANKNLFTCDITKPFMVKADGAPLKFHLITAWEVLEHIAAKDLPQLFDNICQNLKPGGYFIASTSSFSDKSGGIELHQSRMSNQEWCAWVDSHYGKILKRQEIRLAYYELVRYSDEKSFLIYQKNN